MPTVLRERGYSFFFYMADRFEPPHIHVSKDDKVAKLWLDPLDFGWWHGLTILVPLAETRLFASQPVPVREHGGQHWLQTAAASGTKSSSFSVPL